MVRNPTSQPLSVVSQTLKPDAAEFPPLGL
jgi:hypothetical protein